MLLKCHRFHLHLHRLLLPLRYLKYGQILVQ